MSVFGSTQFYKPPAARESYLTKPSPMVHLNDKAPAQKNLNHIKSSFNPILHNENVYSKPAQESRTYMRNEQGQTSNIFNSRLAKTENKSKSQNTAGAKKGYKQNAQNPTYNFYRNSDTAPHKQGFDRKASNNAKRQELSGNNIMSNPYSNENHYEKKNQNIFKAERARGVLQSRQMNNVINDGKTYGIEHKQGENTKQHTLIFSATSSKKEVWNAKPKQRWVQPKGQKLTLQ